MKGRKTKTRVVGCILALAGLFVFSLFAIAGNLEPSAPPGPTMKTLDEIEPRIPISSLPYTISASGSYYLTGDLSSIGTGITVGVDDVTIDLMGHSLIGPGAGSGTNYGIYVEGRSNVEIRNGTVRGFGLDGIREQSSTTGKEHRIIGVRVISNGSNGIMLLGHGHLVKDSTAARNGAIGIYVESGCTMTGNTTYDNQGKGIEAGDGCTVTDNTAFGNGADGIHTGYGCTVTNNTGRNNQEIGIYAGHGCVVIGNAAYYNQWDGILAKKGCTVTGNAARNNQETGIYVDGDGCNVVGNTACNNQHYGIWLAGNSLVDQNTAFNNNQSGGSYSNISACPSCTFGLNHAP